MKLYTAVSLVSLVGSKVQRGAALPILAVNVRLVLVEQLLKNSKVDRGKPEREGERKHMSIQLYDKFVLMGGRRGRDREREYAFVL